MSQISSNDLVNIKKLSLAWLIASALGVGIGFWIFTNTMRPSFDRILWFWSTNGVPALIFQWIAIRSFGVRAPKFLLLGTFSWILGGLLAWALAKGGATAGWMLMIPSGILLGATYAHTLRPNYKIFPGNSYWIGFTVVGLVAGSALATALDPEPLRRLPDPDYYKLAKGAVVGFVVAGFTLLPLKTIEARSVGSTPIKKDDPS